MTPQQIAHVHRALDGFAIELPSWGFANTGTRFGKFLAAGGGRDDRRKVQRCRTGPRADRARARRWRCTCCGICPAEPPTADGVRDAVATASACGRARSIRTCSRISSTSSARSAIRTRRCARRRSSTCLDSVEIARARWSRATSRCGSPTARIIPAPRTSGSARDWFIDGLQRSHDALSADQRMLVEYKPFEPAFYHTDIADWGMALLLARAAGPRARVLVDTGHHYQAQNIEQIVAWLLAEDMLGGFHFNDRRYADDDLTLGSIDPYQVFRIFHEIRALRARDRRARRHRVHDRPEPQPEGQDRGDDPDGDDGAGAVRQGGDGGSRRRCSRRRQRRDSSTRRSCLKDAFSTDVRPAIVGVARSRKGCRPIRWRRSARAATWSASRRSAGTTRSPAAATPDAGTSPQTATVLPGL